MSLKNLEYFKDGFKKISIKPIPTCDVEVCVIPEEPWSNKEDPKRWVFEAGQIKDSIYRHCDNIQHIYLVEPHEYIGLYDHHDNLFKAIADYFEYNDYFSIKYYLSNEEAAHIASCFSFEELITKLYSISNLESFEIINGLNNLSESQLEFFNNVLEYKMLLKEDKNED